MEICSDKHLEICHNEYRICPVCELMKKYEIQIENLEEQVENLKEQVKDLQRY